MPPRSFDPPSIDDNRKAGRAPGGRPNRGNNGGFLGEEGDPRDPIAPRGFLTDAESALGTPRGGGSVRIENADRPRGLLRPPAEEEVPPIIPGDPNNFGARGRRRRSQDDLDASPVLRRGLLGV